MTDIARKLVPAPIEDEMKRSYIDYSMSVIVSRPFLMCVTGSNRLRDG